MIILYDFSILSNKESTIIKIPSQKKDNKIDMLTLFNSWFNRADVNCKKISFMSFMQSMFKSMSFKHLSQLTEVTKKMYLIFNINRRLLKKNKFKWK